MPHRLPRPARLLAPLRRLPAGAPDARPQPEVVSVPVVEGSHTYGAILVQPNDREDLADWQRELVETVGGLIATALRLSEQEDQQRRLALMDERAVIAQELHDSWAQSRPYLKIQVPRLQSQLDRDADREALQAVIAELREGLSSAYRQLRELLSTFRLQINEADFEAALSDTVTEFSRRGRLPEGGTEARLTFPPEVAKSASGTSLL